MTAARDAGAIRVGISSCLLGREVRFDGGHRKDSFINTMLSRYFELVPVCPEVEIGLGVPRDPVRLEKRNGEVRVVGIGRPELDVTDSLDALGRRVVDENRDLSGYIFKSRSPSCGVEHVKIYDADGTATAEHGAGRFARTVMESRPELPVEEEGRLSDPVLRDNFIERVFACKRWLDLMESGLTAARIVDFHARHELTIMAHSRRACRELGRLVARCGDLDPERFGAAYIDGFMAALRRRATRNSHADVLKHVQGLVKDRIDAGDEQELDEAIEAYRVGQVPLVEPVTLLNHHFRHHPDDPVHRQVYLNPQPEELMLRSLM